MVKNYIIIFQILLLVFQVPYAHAQEQNQNTPEPTAFFLSTTPIETTSGLSHVEVETYNIQSHTDLELAQQNIGLKISEDSKTTELFKLEVETDDYKKSELEEPTRKAIENIENSLASFNKAESKAIKVKGAKNNLFKKHYNLTLGFIRFFVNGAVITTSLILGKGVPLEQALVIGVLAGGISGALQIKNEKIFKWLSDSVRLVNTAKKLNLISTNEELSISKSEKILKEIEIYGKWALIETGFLLICQTTMLLLNIPITENLFLTAGKSTLSQGVYEVGILKADEQLKSLFPGWTTKSQKFRNISVFAGSSISVIAAIGSMVGIPYANLGFLTLTASGAIFSFSSKIITSRPVNKLIEKLKNNQQIQPALLCHSLFLR